MSSLDGNLLGIVLAITASLSGALGNLIIRLSWRRETYRKTTRLCGLLVILAADPARIGAMGFGDPSIIAPFSALSLVWLLLLANPIAGDKPTRTEVACALVISCGTVLVGISGSGEEDDAWTQNDDGGNDDKSPTLEDVIVGVQEYSRRWPFLVYMVVQCAFLCACCAVVNLKPPEFWGCRIAWGAVGGCLQGNVYMLKAASSMAVIDFGACMTNGPFWVYTWTFIVIAATGLLVNALAMRYYKATFCVCSFVGWYNVSAAAASAAFFGSDVAGVPLVLYISGLVLVVGGVVVLVMRSFNDALKEEDDSEEEGAGGEGRESFLEKQIGRISTTRGSRSSSAYAALDGGGSGHDEGRSRGGNQEAAGSAERGLLQ